MSENIKRVERELIHKGVVIEYYADHMEFADGKKAVFDFIHHNGAAAVVPVLNDGRILMVRQYRNALERETLEIPAGKLDTLEESGMDCAARELEEETGYRSNSLEWLITIRSTVAFCDERIEIYLAQDLVATAQNLDEDEYVEVEAYTMEELKQMIFAGKIEDSKTIAALMTYESKYLHL
jgi:ADP-ribose pyrophosphatase